MFSKKQVKKTTLSNEQRREIIKYKEKNPNISHVDLAAWIKETFKLEVHSTTIGCLIKNKNDIGDNLSKKKQRTVQYLDLENALLDLEPDTTLATTHLKGKKKDKKQLAVALCANADGTDKFKPFVIDKLPNPWCFKHIKCNRLGVTYKSSIDNAKCYSSSNLNLYNTTIHYLPPNTTSCIQPLDAGIIMSFKCRYKNYFIKWMLDQYESENNNKLNVLNAIKFIVQAWNEVSSETVWILLVVQNNEEPTNDNDDKLMEEMKVDIEALNFRNAMDLEVYINYPEEENTNKTLNKQKILTLVTNIETENDSNDDNSKDEDDSRKISLITYHEVLNAIKMLEHYFMQQDLSDKDRLYHNQALLKLQKAIRKSRSASFKQ
ncbi:13156_t:CDS:2, partial [Dentiscutata erythropus]